MPYEFGGVPFIEARFSPFQLVQFCSSSPVVIAWTHLLLALVASLGAYAFFRRALGVSYWPAAICAWCYPLTAYFIFWLGYPGVFPVAWLPWIFYFVHESVRGARFWAPMGLSLASCLTLISGHIDVAAQVLLVSGIYSIWCLATFRPKARPAQFLGLRVSVLATAWVLGLLLASPYLLPVLEYSRAGMRMARRSSGEEERPPVGLSALPQVVLPDMYGAFGEKARGTFREARHEIQMESSAAAYAGVLATLVVAPLAWCSRRHRSINLFWILISAVGLAWCLDLPLIVQLMRLPGIRMMSQNRLVFVFSFAVLSMAAVGLQVLLDGGLKWRGWFWAPAGVLCLLCAWCAYRSLVLPEPVATQLGENVKQGQSAGWLRTAADVAQVQKWFSVHYAAAAAWCALGLGIWGIIRWRPSWRARSAGLAALLMIADLLSFGLGRNPQYASKLYFPRIEALDEIGRLTPGRVIGYRCLPAALAGACGLRDVRGYDGVDPDRMVELLLRVVEKNYVIQTPYALTQWLRPQTLLSRDGIRLPPILDLLDVRYVVFRGKPTDKSHPVAESSDYWAMENSSAVGRVFVPQHVELLADKDERLGYMSSPSFNPRQVAFVEAPVQLPDQCRGLAHVLSETPTRIAIEVRMETPGLVVLTDRWDPGWQAQLNGKPVPILITDHALRGVVVPAGSTTLEFSYAPRSFRCGLALSCLSLLCLAGWVVFAYRSSYRSQVGSAGSGAN